MAITRSVKVVAAAGAVVVLGVAGAIWLSHEASGTGAATGTTTDSIGDVLQGEIIEHAFVLTNDGPDDLVIKDAIPWASTIVSLDSVIPPGGEGRVHIRLDTRRWAGPMSELIKVHFEGGRRAIWLRLRGRVNLPVQVEPHDRVYFFTVRGEPAEKAVEVVNRQEQPLKILDVQSSNPLFRAEARPVLAGRRYGIAITLDPAAAVGQHRGTVTVRTDSRAYPALAIQALAQVKDVVHTSISQISFSTFAFESLDLEAVHQRSVTVEKHGASDFEVLRATTDVPFLEVDVLPQRTGQSYLVRVRIVKGQVKRGMTIQGTLVIETNDPAFPRLELPISGAVA